MGVSWCCEVVHRRELGEDHGGGGDGRDAFLSRFRVDGRAVLFKTMRVEWGEGEVFRDG